MPMLFRLVLSLLLIALGACNVASGTESVVKGSPKSIAAAIEAGCEFDEWKQLDDGSSIGIVGGCNADSAKLGFAPFFSKEASRRFSAQEGFSDLDGVNRRLEVLAAKYPGLVKRFLVGKSIEDRDIIAIRVSAVPEKDTTKRSQVLISGNMHSREWVATEVTIGFAEELLKRFDVDPTVRRIFTESLVEVWIMPVWNPDGLVFSFEEGLDYRGSQKRFWRKNRRVIGSDFGVDLNRNFEHEFGGPSTSNVPRSDNYHGGSANSEPETKTLLSLLNNKAYFPHLIGYLSVHSFGAEVLYPMGTSVTETSPIESLLSRLGSAMAASILQSGASPAVAYTAKKAAAAYAVGGDAVDTVHLNHNHIPAFTIETRPGVYGCCGFVLEASQIPAAVLENTFSFLTMIHYLASEVDRAGLGVPIAWTSAPFNSTSIKQSWALPCTNVSNSVWACDGVLHNIAESPELSISLAVEDPSGSRAALADLLGVDIAKVNTAALDATGKFTVFSLKATGGGGVLELEALIKEVSARLAATNKTVLRHTSETSPAETQPTASSGATTTEPAQTPLPTTVAPAVSISPIDLTDSAELSRVGWLLLSLVALVLLI